MNIQLVDKFPTLGLGYTGRVEPKWLGWRVTVQVAFRGSGSHGAQHPDGVLIGFVFTYGLHSPSRHMCAVLACSWPTDGASRWVSGAGRVGRRRRTRARGPLRVPPFPRQPEQPEHFRFSTISRHCCERAPREKSPSRERSAFKLRANVGRMFSSSDQVEFPLRLSSSSFNSALAVLR